MKGVFILAGVAQFNKGFVKTTNLQAKKHYKQMTDTDFNNLVTCLRTIKRLECSHHTKEKIEAKETVLDMSKVYETLHRMDIRDNIIEYNETYSEYRHRVEQRVLIRLSSPSIVHIKGRGRTICNVFIVINLTTKIIITSYLNAHDDTHKTWDTRRYSKDLQVRPIVRGGYPLSKWQNV